MAVKQFPSSAGKMPLPHAG